MGQGGAKRSFLVDCGLSAFVRQVSISDRLFSLKIVVSIAVSLEPTFAPCVSLVPPPDVLF